MKTNSFARPLLALLAAAAMAQTAGAHWIYASTDWRFFIGHPAVGPWTATTYVDGGLFIMDDEVNLVTAGGGGGGGTFNPFTGAGVAFFTSDAFGVPADLVLITTVYGIDLTPEAEQPSLTGFNPVEPQLVPVSVETIFSRFGPIYESEPHMTIPLGEIGALLPGHDLSWFALGDPGTVLYVFQVMAPFTDFYNSAGGCLADMNGDGILDLSDINMFVNAFMSGDPTGDLDGNSIFDLNDINAFVASFTGGCP